jgi:hypothetical protein
LVRLSCSKTVSREGPLVRAKEEEEEGSRLVRLTLLFPKADRRSGLGWYRGRGGVPLESTEVARVDWGLPDEVIDGLLGHESFAAELAPVGPAPVQSIEGLLLVGSTLRTVRSIGMWEWNPA